MSLLLWFPFNGDVKNYGTLSSVTALTGFTPIYDSGVIEGTKSLSVDGYHSARTSLTGMENLSNFTLSFWLKMDSSVAPTTTWSDIFTWSMKLGNTSGTCRFEQYKNTKGNFSLYYFNPDSVSATISNRSAAKNTWKHYVLVQDNETAKIYENNVLIKTVTFTTPGTVPRFTDGFIFGLSSNNIGGRIQDFRLYDTVITENERRLLFKTYSSNRIVKGKELAIWLPLVKDSKNHGLANINVTENNTTLNTLGKIGKCYSFNGTSSNLRFTYPIANLGEKFTFSCWIKFNSVSTPQTIICSRQGVGMGFMVILLSSGQLRFDNGTDSTAVQYTVPAASFTPVVNTWYHLICIQTSEQRKLYVNGTLVSTSDTTYTSNILNNTAELVIIGASNSATNLNAAANNWFNGYLNDIRLYNYELSDSEIKKLSQGLILHYLFNDPSTEGTTNLAPSPYLASYEAVSPGWDTTKHPNAVAVGGGWSNGYNGGVTNATAGYHAMWNIIDEIPTIVFQNHNSEISSTNRWMGINTSAYLAATIIPAESLYTISWEQKTIDTLGGYTTGGLYYKIKSSGSNGFQDGGTPKIGQNTKLNTWERFSYTFTRNANVTNASTANRLYIYANNGTESTMLVRNIQIEVKDHMSNFVMYETTEAPNTMIVDKSGNDYHGIILTPPLLSNSSSLKRYAAAAEKKIDTPQVVDSQLAVDFLNASPFSISFWAYSDDWTTPNASASKYFIYAYTSSHGFTIYSTSAGYRYRMYWVDSNGSKRSVYFHAKSGLTVGWNHFVVTYDGSVMRTYRNGVAYSSGTYTFKTTADTPTIKIFGSSLDATNGTPCCFSDLRIFATTLSLDDIKELYAMGKAI